MAKINQYRRYKFFVSLFCLGSIYTHAQKECRLIITPINATEKNIEALKITRNFTTKALCLKYVSQLPSILMAQGYISASVDSTWEDTLSVYCKLFPGEKYLWNTLIIPHENWPILNQLGYQQTTFNNKPFDQNKVTETYNKLLDYFENNGYPFTKIFLDSITLINGSIEARLNIDKGPLYYIDSISLKGNARITKDFLYRYLDLTEHEIYNQSKLTKINSRLAQLPYIEQQQPWQITRLNTGAFLNLSLDARRSNQVNVLVGFLPANAQLGGKLLLTGEATINLKNPFGNGETIGINWQQLQSKSPRLDLVFQRPYLFKSPFGISFNFQLYKRDSDYLNINSQIGLQYILSSKQTGTIFLQAAKTNLLNVDTQAIKLTKRLPANIDISSISLALEYASINTNYRFNPRSGNELRLISAFGNKKIKKNNTILQIKDPLFNYSQLYDSLAQKSYQFRIKIEAAHYFPIAKQATIKTALNMGWFQSPNYFQNELFQIGGYKLLRGFNEESIYTNRYAVGTIEYRYLLAQNSYLFGFTDFGWAKSGEVNNNLVYNYFGIGAGMAFETKAGIFNISFAEGKRNDLSFNLKQSKIHLGFVSLF